MLRIYGYEQSSNVQKVAWACDELGLEFELDLTGGAHRSSKDAGYLRINPNGQIPTLQDGDFLLWESNSILRYLADKYGQGKLVPATPEGRGTMNKWMDWQLAALSPPMQELFQLTLRTPVDKRDPARVKAAAEKAGAMWRRFEADFGDGAFVAGEFSLGDIPVGIFVNRWFVIDESRPRLPKVEAWYARLKERPAYRERVLKIPQPGPKA